jgi:hypothetical protein
VKTVFLGLHLTAAPILHFYICNYVYSPLGLGDRIPSDASNQKVFVDRIGNYNLEVNIVEDSFDSNCIIRKEHYDEFIEDAKKVALTAYTVPAFVKYELYNMIDIERDIAMVVVWKPETTVKQIKDFDKKWFLEKY